MQSSRGNIKVMPANHISADPGRFASVHHLLDNAIKLSPAAADQITLTLLPSCHRPREQPSLGIPRKARTIFGQHKVVSNNNQKAEAEGLDLLSAWHRSTAR